ARKWFSVSHAATARALNSSINLLVLKPRLRASDFKRSAVSSGRRIVSVVIAIPPGIAQVSTPAIDQRAALLFRDHGHCVSRCPQHLPLTPARLDGYPLHRADSDAIHSRPRPTAHTSQAPPAPAVCPSA